MSDELELLMDDDVDANASAGTSASTNSSSNTNLNTNATTNGNTSTSANTNMQKDITTNAIETKKQLANAKFAELVASKKKETCRYFQWGSCRYGDACYYNHVLIPKPKSVSGATTAVAARATSDTTSKTVNKTVWGKKV